MSFNNKLLYLIYFFLPCSILTFLNVFNIDSATGYEPFLSNTTVVSIASIYAICLHLTKAIESLLLKQPQPEGNFEIIAVACLSFVSFSLLNWYLFEKLRPLIPHPLYIAPFILLCMGFSASTCFIFLLLRICLPSNRNHIYTRLMASTIINCILMTILLIIFLNPPV